MSREIVSVKIDVIFKKFFTEHEDMLHAFISDILEIPSDSIRKIEIRNPEMPPETEEGKFSRLDLVLDVDGKAVDVEIQINKQDDFRDRTLFYWAKLYTSSLQKGQMYQNLKKTIAINILDYTLFENREQYHTEVVAALKDTHEIFSDKFSIHFFEMRKVKNIQPNDRKTLWMQFIKADTEEELEQVKEAGGDLMERAVQIVYDMSADGKTRELARWREKSMLDMRSSLYAAETRGEARGHERGKAEGIGIGRAEGEAKNLVQLVNAAMTNTQKPLTEVLTMLGITQEKYDQSLALLNQ